MSRRGFIFALLLLVAGIHPAGGQTYTHRGPFSVGAATLTIQRPDSSSFQANLYYPATSPGDGQPVRRDRAPYPAITFGHGFLTPPVLYELTLQHLASWGFVVIATRSGLEAFPRHDEYALDLIQCLDHLVAESARPGSFLEGAVDPERLGASGHSMGAGASILAAAMDPTIRAVANTAAAETRPSAITAARVIDVPVCLIAGSDDTLVPISRHTGPMFGNLRAPKLLAVLRGGSHCGFVDVPLPDAVCDEAAIPIDQQLRETRSMLTAFFLLYLRDDESAWTSVWGLPRVLNPGWIVDAQPGSSIKPRAIARRVRQGQLAEIPLQVTNEGSSPASFLLGATGRGTGTAPVFLPAVTPVLQPGESTTVRVRVAGGTSVRIHQVFAHPQGEPRTRSVASMLILGSAR